MIKVLIKNAHNTYNYGSMMMCENVINELTKRLNNIEFYIEYIDIDNLQRLKDATNLKNIFQCKFPINNYVFKDNKIRRIERKIRLGLQDFANKVENYNIVIVLGGDDYAETYYNTKKQLRNAYNAIKNIEILSKKSKVYMIGQTIGPYTNKRKDYASKVFKKVEIYTRDKESKEYLQNELKVEANESRDLAFINLKRQEEYEKNIKEILNKYKIEENKYITIVGTGLVDCYVKDKNNFYRNFIEIIKKVKELYPEYKLVWLSHVTTPEPKISDNTLLKKLNEYSENYIINNMIVINKPILPVEARLILGYGYCTITCRMHAAVSTFQMGKPAICLSYSKKYNGVIAKGLNIPELVIEAKGDEFWNNESLNQTISKVKYVIENYSEITNKIQINVDKCKNMILNTIENISKEVKEKN